MILTVTLNPSVDQTLYVQELAVGDTNRVQSCEIDAGGKGANLSRVAVELGTPSLATGFLGGHVGRMVSHVLSTEGVELDFVPIHGTTRTNYNIETLSGGPPTTLNSKGPQISEEEWAQLLDRVRKHLGRASWLAIGGSQPPGTPLDAIRQIGQMAREAGVQLLVDADGEMMRLGLEAGPHLIKPNSKEAGRILGREIATAEEARDAALELLDRISAKADGAVVVISRGKEGAVMATEARVYQGYSPQVEAKSTVGSGDSLLAGMLAARLQGQDWPEALRWGLAAGAATATTNGAEIARREVFDRLLPQAAVDEL